MKHPDQGVLKLVLAFFAGTFLTGNALKVHTNSHNASSGSVVKAVANKTQELVFDFGFFDGKDSFAYLGQGLKVVAVEADPTLVAAAGQNPWIAPYLQNGQLTLLNVAIAPQDQTAESWLPFYMSKCTKEWNSFYSSIGCRSCQAPHAEDATKSTCLQQNILAKPCASVLQQYGTPKYFKLDIEGAEPGCYHALKQPGAQKPWYISAEVGNDKLVDDLAALGYTSFKLVRQQSGHSGGWGDSALDCRTGGQWRSTPGARQELQQIFLKGIIPNDPCPGSAVGGSWYDLHASLSPHQTW